MSVISIEQIELEYAQKKYSGDDSKFNELDKKMINAIFNLRTNYKEEYEKRKCTVYIHELPKSSILEKPKDPKKDSKKADTKKEKENTQVEIIICSAIKMNGEKCTSKAKDGCFVNGKAVCGRHNKS